jgi:hypothetical protein
MSMFIAPIRGQYTKGNNHDLECTWFTRSGAMLLAFDTG